jgi:hypothetical protein
VWGAVYARRQHTHNTIRHRLWVEDKGFLREDTMKVRPYYEKITGERREEFLLSRSEQESAYNDCLQRVLDNPRYYLDNLERLDEFKVNWKNYKKWKTGNSSA